MIHIIRKATGILIAGPFCILAKTLSLFVGKQKAIELLGPLVTTVLRIIAEVSLIPKVHHPMEFGIFVNKMKRNIHNLRLLYDVSVEYEDNDTIVFIYKNCPHCQAFCSLGIPEFGPYACDSDWVIARKNAEMWSFKRSRQIGTGDTYCNHTYMRNQF
jgi:hypothetical protein